MPRDDVDAAPAKRLYTGRALGLVLLAAGATAIAAVFLWRDFGAAPGQTDRGASSLDGIDAVRAEVTHFCGSCHAMPVATSFPKEAWHDEVQQGYDFYDASGRNDLAVPEFERVERFFREQAPDEMAIALPTDDPAPASVTFRATHSPVARQAGRDKVYVGYLRWDSLTFNEPPELLVCDFGSGAIRTCRPERDKTSPRTVARLEHPVHAVPVDLDGDGLLDLVVGDLGSFLPEDHDRGRVVWLQKTGDGKYNPVVLQSDLGRVADVEPGDFDGDGDLDLVVAEFGWRSTGRILLLENQTEPGSPPSFELRVIDPRPGAIHVPVADLDGDGRLDFVALVSQQYETVEAFYGAGDGSFRRQTIYDAGDPAFGSSGIQLVDLDRDGDLDVLHTNGDSFDSYYLKPYHGIRWLENRGGESFEARELALMPGVHRALATDFDGDGDLDIAACAVFPRTLLGSQPIDQFDAVLWLEQTSPGRFARHSLKRGDCKHAVLEVGDFDGDGDPDLAGGGFGDAATQPAVTIWWNEGPQR